MNTILQVNIAEIKVAVAPAVLICIGLGSCVGVALYDSKKRIGGLAHIMLPDSHAVKENTNLAKFADTAIDEMLKEMVVKGADRKKIQAKVFGGANMFSFSKNSCGLMIGERNVKAVDAKLRQHTIPLIAKEVGGNSGRTILFEIATGIVIVRTLKPARERIF